MGQEFELQASPQRTGYGADTQLPVVVFGRWTPTLTMSDSPGDFAVTYTNHFGTWSIVDDLVTLQFEITTASFTHTTANSNIHVEGIPYNVANFSDAAGYGHCSFQGVTAAGFSQLAVVASQNATNLTFALSGSGQNLTSLTHTHMPTGGNVRLLGTVTYRRA